LEPANSGATPLQSATSTAVMRSPYHSGAEPQASTTTGVGPCPPLATRETLTAEASPPRISNDCRRRGGSARIHRMRRAWRRRRVRRLRPRPMPLQGIRVRAVEAVKKLADGSRSLLRPPQGVSLAGRGTLRLGGARPTGCHVRVDRLLVLTSRASCLSRARAHILVVRDHLRPP
jgi:hypothetical protein